MERKLTTIMFTDIVGYSRIMSNDEGKGLELLNYQDKLLQPVIERFNGKILKRMGDALFLEFSSSLNALECSIEMQNVLKDFNENRNVDNQLLLRIGLHIGDVIIREGDLFGEGINVAARLEPLADPGGICMSQAVYDSVKIKSNFSAIRVGDVSLKNIINKYTVYKIPSFYSRDYDEPYDQELGDNFQIKYQIKDITKLPVPSRSIIGTSLFMIPSYIALILLVAFVTFFFLRDEMINKDEIINLKQLILNLKDPQNESMVYVKELLNYETRALIDSDVIGDIPQDSIRIIIQKDLNRLISNGSITYNNDAIKQLNINKVLKHKIIELESKNNSSLVTRLLLGQIFYGSIKESPLTSFESFSDLISSIKLDTNYIIFNMFILIISIYYMAFKAIRISFNDIRDVDKVLEYFVDQMGFKSPLYVKKQLIFKPTLFQIIIWGSSSIKARLDVNSIYLTGNIPIIKKLEKMFKSYEI